MLIGIALVPCTRRLKKKGDSALDVPDSDSATNKTTRAL
jgi:hypothetical protein